MFRSRNRIVGGAVLMIVLCLLAACSATGGRKAFLAAQNGGSNVSAGHANTPHYTVAMITHEEPGDTFWDLIRAGATAAAAKDNITLKYSADPDPTKQAQLITDAIDSNVNGIAVTVPNPTRCARRSRRPRRPASRWSCSTRATTNWKQCGGLMYFGQDEAIAGVAAGKRLAAAGDEERALRHAGPGSGPARGPLRGRQAGSRLRGHGEKLYVNGTDNSAVLSTMSAKLHPGQEHRRRDHPRRASSRSLAIQAENQSHSHGEDLHLRHQRGRDRQDQVRAGAVGHRPAALPAGLCVGRLGCGCT